MISYRELALILLLAAIAVLPGSHARAEGRGGIAPAVCKLLQTRHMDPSRVLAPAAAISLGRVPLVV